MMSSMFIAFLAKMVLAVIALVALRLTLSFFDKAADVSFTKWINKMEDDYPIYLAYYYGLRMIAVAILFGMILS